MAQHNGQIELVGGSLAQLFKINQGTRQRLTPQQQTWYPSHPQQRVEMPARRDPMRIRSAEFGPQNKVSGWEFQQCAASAMKGECSDMCTDQGSPTRVTLCELVKLPAPRKVNARICARTTYMISRVPFETRRKRLRKREREKGKKQQRIFFENSENGREKTFLQRTNAFDSAKLGT